MLFDFISRATRIYEHAWHLLSRKESFSTISHAKQHTLPTSYAGLLLITHAQPQASTAQHPSYSHHYQNRNWVHVYGLGAGRNNAVPTFLTRWNVHPSGQSVKVWRHVRFGFQFILDSSGHVTLNDWSNRLQMMGRGRPWSYLRYCSSMCLECCKG
jgi:hypothetical protein